MPTLHKWYLWHCEWNQIYHNHEKRLPLLNFLTHSQLIPIRKMITMWKVDLFHKSSDRRNDSLFYPIRFFTYGLFLCIWCSCTLCFSISIWMQWRSIIAFSISITLTMGWFNVIIITFYFAAVFYLWTDYLHHLRLGVLLQLSHKPNIALSRMRSHHSDCQNRTRTSSNDATGNSES